MNYSSFIAKQKSAIALVLKHATMYRQGIMKEFKIKDSLNSALNDDNTCSEEQNNEMLDKWIDKIQNQYWEEQRFYHTLTHVASMLYFYCKNYDLTKLSLNDEYEYSAAMFCVFHDVVYDPKSKLNELDSIAEFQDFVTQFGSDVTTTDSFVIECIRDTIKHRKHLDDDSELSVLNGFLLDCDLAVLAGSFDGVAGLENEHSDIYSNYAAGIRREYAHFDDTAYCEGRTAVMKSFLTRDTIYFSEVVREVYEETARANILKEIEQLATK